MHLYNKERDVRMPNRIGLCRENAIAIGSEARDPNGGNVYYDRIDPDVAIKAYRPSIAEHDKLLYVRLHCQKHVVNSAIYFFYVCVSHSFEC